MRPTIRLLVRQQRFEIVAVVLAAGLLAAAAWSFAWQLGAVGVTRDCFTLPPGTVPDATCQALLTAFDRLQNGLVGQVMAGMAILPIVAGVLIGVPLVARELEQGTAPLAWTLGRSRRRWLIMRAGLLAAGLAVVLAIPAAAADALQAARQPLFDPGASFAAIGLHDALPVALGLMTLGISIAAGAVIGRQLPALVVAVGVAIAIVIGATIIVGPSSALARSMTSWQPEADVSSSAGGQGDLFFDQGFRNRVTGTVYSVYLDEPVPGLPMDAEGNVTDPDWLDEHYEPVDLTLPGSAYAAVATAMGLAYGAVALVALGAALMVVDRRRAA